MGYYSYKVHKPKRDSSSFDGEDVHKWIYKCNQYFEIIKIDENEKLKLGSYCLDGMIFIGTKTLYGVKED